MAYTKFNDPWEDLPSTDTPITAAALDTIEEGIDSAWAEIDSMLAGGVAGVDYKGTYNPATAYGKGDVVLYNGVEYVAVNDSTGQTPPAAQSVVGALPVIGRGLTLPASPFDGQEYILVDSLTNPTYQWRFRYAAGSTSPYKWEFVGGPARISGPMGSVTITTGTATLWTSGPAVTTLRAGEYLCRWGAFVIARGYVSSFQAEVSLHDGAAITTKFAGMVMVINNLGATVAMEEIRTCAAGAVLRLYHRCAQSSEFIDGWMSVTPVRVS